MKLFDVLNEILMGGGGGGKKSKPRAPLRQAPQRRDDVQLDPYKGGWRYGTGAAPPEDMPSMESALYDILFEDVRPGARPQYQPRGKARGYREIPRVPWRADQPPPPTFYSDIQQDPVQFIPKARRPPMPWQSEEI